MARNSYFNENTLEELLEEIKYVYQSDKRPWVIGYSGGKDSTTVVELVYKMLQMLPKEERNKNVYIVSSDTLIENPLIKIYLSKMNKLLGEAAKKDDLPIISTMVTPPADNSFWANVIGRGFPTPRINGTFRWCTDRLKINPSANYIRNVIKKEGEEVVVLLGVRKAESEARRRRIEVSMGLVTGKYQEYDKDFIFATIQTLSKEENLQRYEKTAFDAIVIDEAHHSAANSYKKVLEYFEPKLWLGMTATPDKRDDNLEGRNIYEIFNHQIAYEIRLQDAMEEDLLCPFHYFGITDLDIIADAGKSFEEKVENFRYLTSEERVENVMKQAEYFGYSGDRVKGLIFCSRIDEAKELSKKFNDKGWRTLVLSGSDSEEARAVAIERLAGEESEDALDYIISVDIFSEGVDVPEINQVIMLRPTESPIVFIQQLGRGLRKAENKEYVVVLDFIGNYRNNFMIPIALSGDRSYNKDNIRRYVTEGGRVIPGASTIHFDEISRKRIFQAIDNANFSDIKLIRENYTNLKNKLGHIPALADFDKYGEMDVLRIFDNNSLGSYYKFLVKYEKEYTIRLSEDEEKAIEFISKKLASGKRIHELELLKRTLQYHHGIIGRLQKHLSEKYHCEMDEYCTENVINMMTNEFPTSAAKKTYAQCVFLKKEQDDYGISDSYEKMLQNPEFCAILEELVDFGISRYKVNYSYQYQDTNLVLYQKYTYEDACRLLNWERNEVPLNIGGYKYDKKTKTFPIFINYDKQDNISDTTKYEDHFVAENRLIAISKSGRSMDSEDVQNFLNATERGIDVQLFVRKNKDDKISKEFYYLGRVIATGNAKQFVMPNTDKTAVEIEWELETPVREDIYQYIVNEMKKNSNLKYKFEFFFSS